MRNTTIIFLTMLLSSPLMAQFNGGNGDGASKSYTTLALNGNNVAIYNGGNQDGAYRALQVNLDMEEACDYNLVINGATGTQVFQAENNISALGIINASNILLRSGNEVNLLSSFEVNSNGGVFQIELANCPG